MDILKKILDYMSGKKYNISDEEKEINIIYLEGVNTDFSLNEDIHNHFDDLRLVMSFSSGIPILKGYWQATTEPGDYYTYKPMNPLGCARIKFGQYQAWKVGMHGNSEPHEALVQVGEVSVHRDLNKDFVRTGDKVDVGLFGINQHHGYDFPENDIGRASAGCLVGKSRIGHKFFMDIIKSDPRYLMDKNYIFHTTIIPGDKLL